MPSFPGSGTDAIRMTCVGAEKVAAEFKRAAVTVPEESYRATRMYTQLGVTEVKANASGRPGPRTITGDYRRRLNGVIERHGGTVVGIIGTNHPAGRRLEQGFHGVDSLGRHYQQDPFPHFQPMAVKIEALFYASHEAIVRKI